MTWDVSEPRPTLDRHVLPVNVDHDLELGLVDDLLRHSYGRWCHRVIPELDVRLKVEESESRDESAPAAHPKGESTEDLYASRYLEEQVVRPSLRSAPLDIALVEADFEDALQHRKHLL